MLSETLRRAWGGAKAGAQKQQELSDCVEVRNDAVECSTINSSVPEYSEVRKCVATCIAIVHSTVEFTRVQSSANQYSYM